ncbi:MAG TPA: hypothetical protein VF808_00955 [Ktedonobacterales bacterium]
MSHADDTADLTPDIVGRFLRSLAARAERDPHLASVIAASLREAGLLAGPLELASGARPSAPRRGRATSKAALGEATRAALDPFEIWRSEGEEGLRRALAEATLSELRAVVKAHRLDPARVSSRWTVSERVATLIFDQVKARMRHGRAFERI